MRPQIADFRIRRVTNSVQVERDRMRDGVAVEEAGSKNRRRMANANQLIGQLVSTEFPPAAFVDFALAPVVVLMAIDKPVLFGEFFCAYAWTL